jgi:hypothetical protein
MVDTDSFVPGILTGAVLAFFITAFVVSSHYEDERDETRKELIRHGYAEWVIADDGSGATEFVLKEPAK